MPQHPRELAHRRRVVGKVLEGLGAGRRGEALVFEGQAGDVGDHRKDARAQPSLASPEVELPQRPQRPVGGHHLAPAPGERTRQRADAGGALEVEARGWRETAQGADDAALPVRVPRPEELGIGSPLGHAHAVTLPPSAGTG